MVGVGALVLVANREPRAASDLVAPVGASSPLGEGETVEGTDGVASSTILDAPATTPIRPSTSEATAEPTAAPDAADPYLDQTSVVFDEVMNDDLRFVVRLSDVSYGELFDIDWTAPTGSTEECLSGPALITGNPEGLRSSINSASSWDANHLSPLSDERPTDVAMAASAFGFGFGIGIGIGIEPDSATTVFVVRTRLPVSEVVVEGDGITTTSAEIIDGVAAFEVTAETIRDETGAGSVHWDEASITLQPEPGADVDPSLLTLPLFGGHAVGPAPPDCVPTFPPDVELPPPGEQPSDPAGAEAIIRDRFALAVDSTIPFGAKPDDLFDSPIGLEQAIDEALAGPNAEYVRDARYEIVDLMFTSPGEAWFQYDLDALGVSFRPFGRATSTGESWQISRNTICQDLAHAGVLCDPPASPETPAVDATVAPPTTLSEQQLAAYADSLFCNPIRPCPDR